jgi:phosphatidylserine/phosphatidylglycerophosphate/cardiolipin synthase-like enzyme
MIKKSLPLFLLFSFSLAADAAPFSTNSSYSVCFTPGQDCTGEIVELIGSAKRELLVMGYSFTSAPIAKALSDAKKRGVDVKVLLDKSQKSQKYTSLTYLVNQGIPVWIDHRPAIAHNKVLIVDRETVQTGSFNYTKAAQKRNAENVLIIRDAGLAKEYAENWDRRMGKSVKPRD